MRLHNRKTITIPKIRETITREALCREKAVRIRREEDAIILTDIPFPEPPPPRPYVPTSTNYFALILSACNPLKFLP